MGSKEENANSWAEAYYMCLKGTLEDYLTGKDEELEFYDIEAAFSYRDETLMRMGYLDEKAKKYIKMADEMVIKHIDILDGFDYHFPQDYLLYWHNWLDWIKDRRIKVIYDRSASIYVGKINWGITYDYLEKILFAYERFVKTSLDKSKWKKYSIGDGLHPPDYSDKALLYRSTLVNNLQMLSKKDKDILKRTDEMLLLNLELSMEAFEYTAQTHWPTDKTFHWHRYLDLVKDAKLNVIWDEEIEVYIASAKDKDI